jgi:hypothetical protein
MAKRNQSRATKRNRERALANAMARRIEPAEGEPTRERARIQSPLQRLHQRKTITDEQFAAGERFRSDFELACHVLGPAPIAARSFELASRTAPNRDITEAQLGRYERYQRAVAALGPYLALPVQAIACHEQTAEEWAACYGLSRHRAVAWFELGLELLVDHYGLRRRGPRRIPIHAPPPEASAA